MARKHNPSWHNLVDQVSPFVVKIETPSGHGTGFLCVFNDTKSFCGIATAYHVVRHADIWHEPIRILHSQSSSMAFLTEEQRVVLVNPENDSAVILFPSVELEDLPRDALPMMAADEFVKVGVEVGWLGFPSVAPTVLSFFCGRISSTGGDAYFIDGVAINGVSGGPVFYYDGAEESISIIGTISAYYPNLATGKTLPGLAFAQDVTYFHDVVNRLRSIDQAREEKQKGLETSFPSPAREEPPADGG